MQEAKARADQKNLEVEAERKRLEEEAERKRLEEEAERKRLEEEAKNLALGHSSDSASPPPTPRPRPLSPQLTVVPASKAEAFEKKQQELRDKLEAQKRFITPGIAPKDPSPPPVASTSRDARPVPVHVRSVNRPDLNVVEVLIIFFFS